MAPGEMLAAVQKRPFQPFRLHLSNGSSYDVRHPEMVIVGQRTSVLGYPRDDATELISTKLVYVDMLHVTHLEELEQPHRAE